MDGVDTGRVKPANANCKWASFGGGLFRASMSGRRIPHLTLFTAPACSLCDVAKAELALVQVKVRRPRCSSFRTQLTTCAGTLQALSLQHSQAGRSGSR